MLKILLACLTGLFLVIPTIASAQIPGLPRVIDGPATPTWTRAYNSDAMLQWVGTRLVQLNSDMNAIAGCDSPVARARLESIRRQLLQLKDLAKRSTEHWFNQIMEMQDRRADILRSLVRLIDHAGVPDAVIDRGIGAAEVNSDALTKAAEKKGLATAYGKAKGYVKGAGAGMAGTAIQATLDAPREEMRRTLAQKFREKMSREAIKNIEPTRVARMAGVAAGGTLMAPFLVKEFLDEVEKLGKNTDEILDTLGLEGEQLREVKKITELFKAWHDLEDNIANSLARLGSRILDNCADRIAALQRQAQETRKFGEEVGKIRIKDASTGNDIPVTTLFIPDNASGPDKPEKSDDGFQPPPKDKGPGDLIVKTLCRGQVPFIMTATGLTINLTDVSAPTAITKGQIKTFRDDSYRSADIAESIALGKIAELKLPPKPRRASVQRREGDLTLPEENFLANIQSAALGVRAQLFDSKETASFDLGGGRRLVAHNKPSGAPHPDPKGPPPWHGNFSPEFIKDMESRKLRIERTDNGYQLWQESAGEWVHRGQLDYAIDSYQFDQGYAEVTYFNPISDLPLASSCPDLAPPGGKDYTGQPKKPGEYLPIFEVEDGTVKVQQSPAKPDDRYALSKGSWGQPYADQWALGAIGWLKKDGASILPEKAYPVTVAVIDSGIDLAHPDLVGALWFNRGEIPGNGIDDDKNGYVDDSFGWNFADNNSDVTDRSGHGTVVASIIAAAVGDGLGIAGINPWARIMALKAVDFEGRGTNFELAKAIAYAADNGARVINISLGTKGKSRTVQAAIDYAAKKNVLIVVASGNEGINTADFYPSGLRNVLTVAATDQTNKRLNFSNWGGEVSIAAPGSDILAARAWKTDLLVHEREDYKPRSAFVGDDHYRVTGSSFSAPLVSGVASLILSTRPKLTAEQVKRMILHSAVDIETPGKDQYTGYGLLNAEAAIQADPEFFVEAQIAGVEAVKKQGEVFIRVLGSADADKLARVWIEIAPAGGATEWTKVSQEKNSPVKNGVLADIAARHFRGAKQWTLRLIAEHRNGSRREARFSLNLG